MKKIIIFIILSMSTLLITGCSTDSMEDITIYTSVYPIEYVSKELYGDYSTIYNIYPQGINPYKYKFTDKQLKDYGSSDLVIYDGLGNEKDSIVKMINKNKGLKIIDATNRIQITTSENEIWINPSNILIIARNIKDGLIEYVNSSLIEKEINEKYEKLKIEISNIDVDLKEMGENAPNKTLIVQDDEMLFLSKYNLNVISLDEKNITDKIFSDAKDAIENNDIKYIYLFDGEEANDYVKKLMDEIEGIEIIYLDPIYNISSSAKNDGYDYVDLMNENIDKLKQELY